MLKKLGLVLALISVLLGFAYFLFVLGESERKEYMEKLRIKHKENWSGE